MFFTEGIKRFGQMCRCYGGRGSAYRQQDFTGGKAVQGLIDFYRGYAAAGADNRMFPGYKTEMT